MSTTREQSFDLHSVQHHNAALILDEAVAGIPTVFGKLVWLSSLRVDGSGEYRDSNLERIVPPGKISSALHDLHHCVFQVWLALGIQEQLKDFTEYLEAFRLSVKPEELLSPEIREDLIPPDARKAERYLFDTDLAIVLELAEN